MGMFETTGTAAPTEKRKENTLRKLDRMKKALRHEEPDRVPISDFFWGSFIRRWRADLGLPEDANPYYHYDLDWIVTVSNMDPWIRPFETLKETAEEVVVKTGYGAVMRKVFSCPMPEFIGWETDTLEKLEAAEFDDPCDRRRLYSAGDNQIAGVGDGFEPQFAAVARYGQVVVARFSRLWQHDRVLGVPHPAGRAAEPSHVDRLGAARMGAVINRIGQFYLDCARAAIDAAGPWLDGFVIWGDVAYKRATFMHPDYWRKYYKPWVKAIADYAHGKGLDVIYHGCGNVGAIFQDYIDAGIDALNPLEAKAGMDVLDLRRRFGHQMAFCGNSNIQVWETGDRAAIRREVLRKLNAGRGGGLIFQSDHSVSSSVSGQTYDYIVGLVRQYGTYPLELGEFNEGTT